MINIIDQVCEHKRRCRGLPSSTLKQLGNIVSQGHWLCKQVIIIIIIIIVIIVIIIIIIPIVAIAQV